MTLRSKKNLEWERKIFKCEVIFAQPSTKQLRSRGSTFRSSSNPMGSNQGTCGLHNIMVARLIILLVICMAKKVWWCLEQPRGSLLEGHVLFQRMLQLPLVVVERVTCCLGHFGGDSMKPIWVYSSNFSQVNMHLVISNIRTY